MTLNEHDRTYFVWQKLLILTICVMSCFRCTKCTLEDDGEDESMESESEDDTENDTPTKES